jgi:mannose-6-phosphate isomerase-like protein (cupin superfamily)
MFNLNNLEPIEWAKNCFAWSLLESENASVLRETMGPHTTEQLHLHNKATQLFLMLQGEAHLQIDGQVKVLKQGENITVSPMSEHKIENRSSVVIEFLVISTPPHSNDRINIE